MSVCTQKYRTLTGKHSEVTVARSPLHEGGGCLIVGCEQAINLSNIIKDSKYPSVTGLFFHSLSSSEIVNELYSQTILDIQSFHKVIFQLSNHDISLPAEFDLPSDVERIKNLFFQSDLFISDYIISPQTICSGLLSVIERNNLILENIQIHLVKISYDLREKDQTRNHLPVPICDFFTEIDNADKYIVTMEGTEKIFHSKYLGILCSKNADDSPSMPLPSQEFPQQVGTRVEQLTQSCTHPAQDSMSMPLPSQEFPQQVGTRVEQLPQSCTHPAQDSTSMPLLSQEFPQQVGTRVEQLSKQDFPPLVGARVNQPNQICTHQKENPKRVSLPSLENPPQGCPIVPQPIHPVTRVVQATLDTPEAGPVIPVLSNVSGISYFTSNNIAAFPPLTESPQPKKTVRVERWVKVSKQRPQHPPHNTDQHNNYHPVRTKVSFCQPNPSVHTESDMRPKTKLFNNHSTENKRDLAGSSIPTNSSATSNWPYSRQYYKVFCLNCV